MRASSYIASTRTMWPGPFRATESLSPKTTVALVERQTLEVYLSGALELRRFQLCFDLVLVSLDPQMVFLQ